MMNDENLLNDNEYCWEDELAYYASFMNTQSEYNEYLTYCNTMENDTPLALEYFGG